VEQAEIASHASSDLDAVVLWHVVEHLEDPAAALSRVRGWVRPGGLVLVGVPNLASLQARIAGASWLHLDVPRHRTHFTGQGLGALLGRSGLRPVRTTHFVAEHNPAAMWMALLSRAGARPGLPFHVLKRNIRPTAREWALLATGIPALPVAVVLEALAGAARRGGTIATVAQREE
jgi:SAM-dependent methyltransferase